MNGLQDGFPARNGRSQRSRFPLLSWTSKRVSSLCSKMRVLKDPIDLHPSNHWMFPPLPRGRTRRERTLHKPKPCVLIPRRGPKRFILDVTNRTGAEDGSQIKKSEEDKYCPPLWAIPAKFHLFMRLCTDEVLSVSGIHTDAVELVPSSSISEETCSDPLASILERSKRFAGTYSDSAERTSKL